MFEDVRPFECNALVLMSAFLLLRILQLALNVRLRRFMFPVACRG